MTHATPQSLDPRHLRDYVIRPVLHHLELWSPEAEVLLLGTAAQESHLKWLRQHGLGPALGIYQCERATHDDLWRNYLGYQSELAAKVRQLISAEWSAAEQLIWNLGYATAIARVHYRRIRAPLPAAWDLAAQAAYWKRYYNTVHGKGTVEEYVTNFGRYVAPWIRTPTPPAAAGALREAS